MPTTPIIQALSLIAAAGLLAHAASAQTFTIIPQLSGGTGGNTGAFVAGYGQHIIGDSDSSHTQAADIAEGYRFDRLGTPGSALLGMGALDSTTFSSHAAGVCADGAFVVGTSMLLVNGATSSGYQPRAFMWNQFSGAFNLGISGSPAGDLGSSYAYAISGDGGSAIGSTTTSTSSILQAFKWNGSFLILPPLAGSGATNARACSFNAFVIVGDSSGLPFRWTNTGGAGTTDGIPVLGGAPDGVGSALGVNINGSIIVGRISSPTFTDGSTGTTLPQPTAFRWTVAGNQNLGALPSTGTQFSEAVGVSSSGFVIVGNSRTAGTMANGTTEAFVWTPRWGVTRLADKLGVSIPPNVVLRAATGVSFDGQVICGTATDTQTGATFAYTTIPAYCVGDHNDNGVLEVQDIFDFLNDWFAGLPKADANGDGVLQVQDIFDFLNTWFAGC